VGSGGIMLPNHPALVVAEQVAALEALHPGRIDLGVGRAPGTDPATAAALRRSVDALGAEDFPRDLLDLMGLLGDRREELRGPGAMWKRFAATPAAASSPQILLLGSSGYSAQLAGVLGLPFAFAHHFDTGGTIEAAELYRRAFQPSPVLAASHLIVTANVLVAPTTEEAERESVPGRLMVHGIRHGRFEQLHSPDDAAAHPAAPAALAMRSNRIVGTPAAAVDQLDDLLRATVADEVMISTVAHGLDARLRSLELLASAWNS
jgi:luciferase family oxidoreductase group 1